MGSTNKITSVSPSAAHPHVPLPKSSSQPVPSLASTISSLHHVEKLPDPNCDLLSREIQEAMIEHLIALLQLQAQLEQSPTTRLQNGSTISKEEVEKRLAHIKKALQRLEDWVTALKKRIHRIENGGVMPPATLASPSKKEKSVSKVRKVLQYLSWIFKI